MPISKPSQSAGGDSIAKPVYTVVRPAAVTRRVSTGLKVTQAEWESGLAWKLLLFFAGLNLEDEGWLPQQAPGALDKSI